MITIATTLSLNDHHTSRSLCLRPGSKMSLVSVGVLLAGLCVVSGQEIASLRAGEKYFIDLPELDVLPYTLTPQFQIKVVEKTTTSLKIHWTTSDDGLRGNVTSWNVRYKIGGEEFKSDELPLEEEFFIIGGLNVDTVYLVCVSVRVNSDYNLKSSKSYFIRVSCAEVSTIPYIRADSVVALLLTLTTIAVGVLVGIIKWWLDTSRRDKFLRTSARSVGDSTELDDMSQTQRLQPQCSIEETR